MILAQRHLRWGLVSGLEAKLVEGEGTGSPALPVAAQMNSQASGLGLLPAGRGWEEPCYVSLCASSGQGVMVAKESGPCLVIQGYVDLWEPLAGCLV